MSHAALLTTDHRPWPLPERPWAVTMDWEDLLFLHWAVPAAKLQALLPSGLEVETWDGAAWLGVVPFRMARTRLRWLPPVPTTRGFPELNVRTYVRRGDRSGVWFFRLDAQSRLVVAAARSAFRLPYLYARIDTARDGDAFRFASERRDRRAPPAAFGVRWRAAGRYARSRSGTLEHFLTERYCMFVAGHNGEPLCGDVAHAPWQLAPATVDLEVCDVTRGLDLALDGPPLSALVARDQTVVGWSVR